MTSREPRHISAVIRSTLELHGVRQEIIDAAEMEASGENVDWEAVMQEKPEERQLELGVVCYA